MQKGFYLFILLTFYSNSVFLAQTKGQIDSLNRLDYTYISNNLQKCQQEFIKGINFSVQISYPLGEASSCNNLALVYSLLGDYRKSIAYNLRSLRMYEKLKKYDQVARIYGEIGYRIRYIDLNNGKAYFRKAINIGEKHKIGANLAAIYNNYGETIKNENLDSALYFFNKSLQIAIIGKDSLSIPFSYNKMAEAYAKKKIFNKAFAYLKKSDNLRFSASDSAGIADNIAYRADVFYEIPQMDSAIFYYEKSLKIATRVKYNSLERFCLERLALLYQKKLDFRNALLIYQKFIQLKDSALNQGVKSEMANLEIKYDTEKTKRELAENESKLASNQKNLTIVLAFVVILILTIWFVYRYQYSKRQNQLKEVRLNKELETTKLEKEFIDEKFRIARELHDNIGSHLTFMISSLDNLSYLNDPEKRIEKISDLSNFGRLTMKDLRDTIWAMNHEEGTIELLITRILELRAVLPANLSVDLKSDVPNTTNLSGIQLLNLYRIVQEFIQNTIKYADANLITISITKNAYRLHLEISDNGKGFSLETISFGNGILNMKRRCEDVFGNFEITSNENGTKITCDLPLNK